MVLFGTKASYLRIALSGIGMNIRISADMSRGAGEPRGLEDPEFGQVLAKVGRCGEADCRKPSLRRGIDVGLDVVDEQGSGRVNLEARRREFEGATIRLCDTRFA